MLYLFEELLLLSIHEAKGTFIGSTADPIKPGLGGAILAELVLSGKIQTSKNHRLVLVDHSQTDIKILNDALHILEGSEKERKIGYWINALSPSKDKNYKQIIEGLIQKGIVTQDDDRLVWVSPSPLQSDSKASAKFWVNRRLRNIVLAGTESQPRDIVLLSLLRACGLLYLVFLRDERKLASRTINEMFYGRAMEDPGLQVIQEIESAIADLVEED